MTKLAILADIHGNLPALEAVRADLADFPVDLVVVAGDVINWGPFSAQVMACVVEAGWAVIRGNNEYYLTDYRTSRAPAAWSGHDQWPLLPWLRAQMAPRWTTTVAAWPDSLSLRFPDAPAIRVVHGSPRGNNDPIFVTTPEADLAARLAGVDEPTLIAAHTHLPLERRVQGVAGQSWQVLNPGSVGVPLDGQHVARYMLLESSDDEWRATWRELPFDPAPVLREFERQDFLAQCGVIGHFVVAEFQHARLELRPFILWHEANCPERQLTPDILDDYARVDPLPYVDEPYWAGWKADGAR